ncbi:MAG: hypothetical protein KAU90_03690, partial [Sulfurovaceae bacterium]|nr:hypothetical protein [Sulfurovaceae bacterium]
KEFKKLFPDYLYNQNREKKIIKTIPFNTQKSKEILLEGLKQGEYKLTLYTTNKYRSKIEQIKNIIIYDIHQTKPPYQTYLWHKLDKNSYSVGSTATLYLKSSIPHTKVLFTLIQDNKTLKEEWIDINSSAQQLIPIKKEYRGDVFYTLTLMKDSRKYIQSGVIQVPWDNKLKVEYISFRDKIDINNTQEQWKIKVTNKKGEKVDAQMLATMFKSDNSIQHHFNIGNLYPKHHIGKYSIWKSYKIKQNEIKTKPKNSLDKRSFFTPNLQTDKEGNIVISLKDNHQIGHQKFVGFIHTKDLKTAITQKELMVKGNIPKPLKKPIKSISNKKIITKNRILFIEAKEKKVFVCKELKESNNTQKNYKLNLEFTSNPSWYALQAMPYILNNPNKSSQEIFHKYFISQIAYKLLKISPELDEIIKNWKSSQDKKVVEIFNI